MSHSANYRIQYGIVNIIQQRVQNIINQPQQAKKKQMKQTEA